MIVLGCAYDHRIYWRNVWIYEDRLPLHKDGHTLLYDSDGELFEEREHVTEESLIPTIYVHQL